MSEQLPEFPPDTVWIGSDHPFDLHEAYLCFRSPDDWQLEQIPDLAELFISADSRYKLWVNGQFVARGPARSFPHAQCVDHLEITPYLRSGQNTLAIQVYQPGYSHFAYVHRGAAGLLLHLICDGHTTLVTNEGWRTRRDPSFVATVQRASIYLGGVEERDLNLADNWINSTYDDTGWSAARSVAPVGGFPWTAMQLRSVPQLNERLQETTLIETRAGANLAAQHADAHLALRQAWFAALPHKIQPDNEGWFTISLDAGQSAWWLYDLARGYSCQGWAEARSASGREQVRISYTEKMQDGQVYLSNPDTYCRVRMTDSFRLRPGEQIAESFSLRGGRFILFQLNGPTGPGFQIRFHVRIVEYPLTVTHELQTSDPLLNKIITMCENTIRACLKDGFIDNPWRESAQWLGDALPSALTMIAMSKDARPLRRVLELASQGAYPDGVLPGVVPGEVHAYTVMDFNFQWVELLHFYQNTVGNDGLVGKMWPTLVKILDRFSQDIREDGLLYSQPGRRLFLDWSPISRKEPSAVYNLHFLLALRKAAQIASKRGAADDANGWDAQATTLRATIREAFWHEERWYDDVDRSTFSQLAASLALLSEATDPADENKLLVAISARSLDLDDEHSEGKMVLASPFMHHRVFTALRQAEKPETVVEIIRRRWGSWVEAGYPTTWENWDVDFPDGSQCHAFSAHPRYHLAEIAREGSRLLSEIKIA